MVMKAAATSVTATVDDTLKLGCTANAKPTPKEVGILDGVSYWLFHWYYY